MGDNARTLEFRPTTLELLCASGPGPSGPGLFAISASRITLFVAPFAPLSTPFHPGRLSLNT
jgi:hypothetical protein